MADDEKPLDAATEDHETIDLTAPRPGGQSPRVQTLDITVPSPAIQPRVEFPPYDPEKQRDYVRLVLTAGLLTMLLIVVVWACRESASWPNHWNQTKEMLQIILPALVGLIGSVIGFYFGASKTGGTPTSPKTGP